MTLNIGSGGSYVAPERAKKYKKRGWHVTFQEWRRGDEQPLVSSDRLEERTL
jgi:hypothetical protein